MNDAMVEYWNGDVGRTWAAMQQRMDASLAPVGTALLLAAAARPGERMLDIGCGAGDTALALTAAVAPDGSVVGVDISAALLDLARSRAAAGDIAASFIEADAANYVASPGFNAVVSRFGVMFFDDPVAAFTNIRGLLAPGGRLVFACWRAPVDNEWATLPIRALADLLPAPVPVDPFAPGPFAFADPDRVRQILAAAGWRDVALTGFDFAMQIGEGADPAADAAHFSLRIGPASRAIATSGIDPGIAAAALAKAYAAHVDGNRVALPAGTWLESARA